MSTLAGTVYGNLVALSFHAGVNPSFYTQRGLASNGFVKNGIGDYTFETLSGGGIDLTKAIVTPGVRSSDGVPVTINVDPVDSTHFRVRTFKNDGGSSQGIQVVPYVASGSESVDGFPVNLNTARADANYQVFGQQEGCASVWLFDVPDSEKTTALFVVHPAQQPLAGDTFAFFVISDTPGSSSNVAIDSDFWILITQPGN